MFWERFYSLCEEMNSKPNPVGKEIGISSGIITKWKTGALPNGDTLLKLAEYFDVSVDYLLGKTDIKKFPTESSREDRADIKREFLELFALLTPEQKAEIIAFLSLSPEQRKAVLTIAGSNDTEDINK